ncbi:molybdopterin-binding oxidoreductase [Aeromonas sobria]|uniref:Molybdopterin-binding oxidoreductase n=1 Tax=Aeromonas sobria TaxID=646 RepID=A0A1S2CKL3_AERSO|nr:molybdopterin-binding oxidoreductase [Aeromonas sobria]MBS4687323.1 molybdopterin-binding oxidoreductase [Aeromonas sobria]OHY88608.1 molybdopterin-binding oxidoreductase [Aeromonas sobria]
MNVFGCIALLLSLVIMPTASAEALTGPVILKVSGDIKSTDEVDGKVLFDLVKLQALPQHEVVTGNPWVDKPHRYRGPKLADLLASVGASGKTVILTALNSFQISIEWEKVAKYDPILAWQDDGVVMRVRDKGPIWFMLPLDQYPELKRSEYTDMMIWQLDSIDIQR